MMTLVSQDITQLLIIYNYELYLTHANTLRWSCSSIHYHTHTQAIYQTCVLSTPCCPFFPSLKLRQAP